MQVKLYKRSDVEIIEADPHFDSAAQRIASPLDISSGYNEMPQKIFESFATYTNQGSGWIFSHVIGLSLKIYDFSILNSSNYIELQKYLASKKAIINIQNEDNEWFKYSVLSALHYYDNHPERVSRYKNYLVELNFKDIKSPVSVKGIDKFEKQNPQSINV